MKFLLQTIDNEIVYDFAFALEQSKVFYGWLMQDMAIKHHEGTDFTDVGTPDEYVPVGAVEFVSEYLRRFYPECKEALRPLNVPETLFPFAGRHIVNVWYAEDYAPMAGIKDIYVKSMDTIKDPWNGPKYDIPGKYEWKDFRHCQVSELIDIASEWRALVFHNDILYVANYGGDPLLFPDAGAIREMTKAYAGKAPVAYTLDVAVTGSGDTVVIECHRFFSCGLYGYNDHRRYPVMLSQAWKEMIRKNRQKR